VRRIHYNKHVCFSWFTLFTTWAPAALTAHTWFLLYARLSHQWTAAEWTMYLGPTYIHAACPSVKNNKTLFLALEKKGQEEVQQCKGEELLMVQIDSRRVGVVPQSRSSLQSFPHPGPCLHLHPCLHPSLCPLEWDLTLALLHAQHPSPSFLSPPPPLPPPPQLPDLFKSSVVHYSPGPK
jgi:hypothetical protein